MPRTTYDHVFKFLSVRAPQLITTDETSIGFIPYPVPLTGTAPAQPAAYVPIPSLAEQLLAAANSSHAIENANALVTSYYLDPAEPLPTISDLSGLFGNLLEVQRTLKEELPTMLAVDFQARLEALIGNTVGGIIEGGGFNKKKLQVWDNLLAQVVQPQAPQLREALTATARIIWIMERLHGGDPLLNDLSGINTAMDANVLLPEEIFPLPTGAEDFPESEGPAPEEADAADIAATFAEIVTLEAARDNLLEVFEDQRQDIVRTQVLRSDSHRVSRETNPNFQSSGFRNDDALTLQAASYNKLAQPTQTALTALNIASAEVQVPFAIEKVTTKLAKLHSKTIKGVGKVPMILVGTSLIRLDDFCLQRSVKSPCQVGFNGQSIYTGPTLPLGHGSINPAGIGDLLVIRQELLKYEAGEIAHIENVLQSEKKVRTHRRLDRVEESYSYETETTSESTRDTQSTERFGLEKEASKIVKSDQEFSAGLEISAKYGPVKATAHVDYASSSSSSEAISSASSYAKSVTDRVVSKLTERVKEQRSRTTLTEIEENNEHIFDNVAGTDHVTGIFHWVDKYYQAQLVNFGARMMYDFMVPEPAAFHIYSQASKETSNTLYEPISPEKKGIESFESINDANYAQLTKLYGVQNVTPPPREFKVVAGSYNANKIDEPPVQTYSYDNLNVPVGYEAKTAAVNINVADVAGWAQIFIGNNWYQYKCDWTIGMSNETELIPFTVITNSNFVINVEVTCRRTDRTYTQWKIQIFNAIFDAYKAQLAEYNQAISALEIQSGISISGDNPGRNREVEKEELKKSCLELITRQRFSTFNAMVSNHSAEGYPEAHPDEAEAEGKYIRFFENAFEWEQITYIFYPYFWGRKANWTTVKQFDSSDPLFAKFLRAGAARVQVPVRPGFESAILHYMSTGEIWSGGDVPVINDPEYLSIVNEVKAGQDDSGTPVGDPWIVKVPTSLVMLQSNPATLPDNSGPGGFLPA